VQRLNMKAPRTPIRTLSAQPLIFHSNSNSSLNFHPTHSSTLSRCATTQDSLSTRVLQRNNKILKSSSYPQSTSISNINNASIPGSIRSSPSSRSSILSSISTPLSSLSSGSEGSKQDVQHLWLTLPTFTSSTITCLLSSPRGNKTTAKNCWSEFLCHVFRRGLPVR